MTLHLGGDVVIPMKDIIAIFDMPTSTISEINNEFLEIAKEEGFIEKISDEIPKTFVLAELKHKTMIFLSPISSSTLLKRTNYIKSISHSNSIVRQEG
ncbi:MAG: DUF370 domain-containing protein [Clostridiales bacterium]|mgnify:CR=1 FL=1|nr:DUF370 domain-containing protein [Clostridiales bacterium]